MNAGNLNPNGKFDDELNRQIDRLLMTGQPSGNPLLDDLTQTVPTPTPRFQQALEDQLLASLYPDRSQTLMTDSHGSKVVHVQHPPRQNLPEKTKPTRRMPSFTFAAAVIATLIIGSVIFAAIRPPQFVERFARQLGIGLVPTEQTAEVSAEQHTNQAFGNNSLYITHTPVPRSQFYDDDVTAFAQATQLIAQETQHYLDLTATTLATVAQPNGLYVTVTPVALELPPDTRLVTIPMSRFAIRLDYFVVAGDIVNLRRETNDEIVLREMTVLRITPDEIAFAVKIYDVPQLAETLQSDDAFSVELVILNYPTATATLTPSLTQTPLQRSSTSSPLDLLTATAVLPIITTTPTLFPTVNP